jgi:hypothetical protein
MKEKKNTEQYCRCLRREEWSPPLPDGAPTPMSILGYSDVVLAGGGSFNRLGRVHELCLAGSVGSARFWVFADVRSGGCSGLGIAADFRLPKGRLLNAIAF